MRILSLAGVARQSIQNIVKLAGNAEKNYKMVETPICPPNPNDDFIGNKISTDLPVISPQKTPERIQWEKEMLELKEKEKTFENQIKFIQNELGQIDWHYPVSEDQPFKASEMASYIKTRAEYSIITDKNSEVLYLYVKCIGVYRKDGEQILRTLINETLGLESTTHRINETIALLKIQTYATITAPLLE